MLTPADLQRQTLRLYGELLAHSTTLASRLVFASGPQSSATGLPAAVSIAGGTSLVLDPDASVVKAVFRQGGIDFVVNTLDEAIRVLKNEIRKRTPLSVALVSPIETVLDEMAERGVVPDLRIRIDDAMRDPVTSVATLDLKLNEGFVSPSGAATKWLAARGWSEVTFASATTAELRALDVKIMQSVETADIPRLQWLRRIPHYQRPSAEAGRAIWISATEAAFLAGS